MKIGIMSDTHGNMDLALKAMDIMIRNESVQEVWHLGDSWSDKICLEGRARVPIKGVPGLYCPEYEKKEAPRKLVITIEKIHFAIAHSSAEFSGSDIENSDILVYGHTHVAKLEHNNGKLLLNPGHLKSDFDRGQSPSFAVLDVHGNSVTARILNMERVVLFEDNYEARWR